MLLRCVIVLGWLASTAVAVRADVRLDLEELFTGQALSAFGTAVDLDRLRPAYEAHDFAPIWVNDGGIETSALSLLIVIGAAAEDGLNPADYRAGLPEPIGTVASTSDLARLDLLLSNAFLNLARDLHSGRTTPSISAPDIVIARKPVRVTEWLDAVRISGPDKVIRSLMPRHRQYAQLRSMLAGYRAIAQRGGWPGVPAGETLKPGMQDPRVLPLRDNLTGRGYDAIDGGDAPDVYDEDLELAVRHFQRRHGLEVDGAVGPATLAALNVSAEERVRQIIVNLERWRWLPEDLGRRYVLVNQAFFFLEIVEDGQVADYRRVIVGKPYHKSPMFSDTIRFTEFNPTWTVPQSIARSEMLPKLRSDPGYLARNDMVLYRDGNPVNPYAVDWASVSSHRFPYRIVQQPGSKNALGRVKFMFPNRFSVYLHDTPSRNLFSRTGRAFSHGCIRVENPLEFAARLLGPDQGFTEADAERIVASRKRTRIDLRSPVRVHLTYFTAWIDDDGIPQFFEDIYGRDKIVRNVIDGAV
jgi:murein L,D-transpeptidase YcbB/YkuD